MGSENADMIRSGGETTAADAISESGNVDRGEKPLFDEKIIDEVPVELDVVMGHAELTVSALLALGSGSVVELGSNLNHKAELRLNGRVIAYGELVAAGEKFGLKITEIGD